MEAIRPAERNLHRQARRAVRGHTQSDEKTNPPFKRGIRIGSAKDGKVTAFIPDADPDGTGEGVAADADGHIYGALTAGQTLKQYVRSSKPPAQ